MSGQYMMERQQEDNDTKEEEREAAEAWRRLFRFHVRVGVRIFNGTHMCVSYTYIHMNAKARNTQQQPSKTKTISSTHTTTSPFLPYSPQSYLPFDTLSCFSMGRDWYFRCCYS
jgi:hypothetical protein